MKKIALLCVICMLMGMFTCYAEDDTVLVSVTDVAGDIVTVSGAAPADTLVTVMILNPGKTVSDIDFAETEENTDVIQAVKPVLSIAGKFSAEIKINTNDGGLFTAIVQAGSRQYSKQFTFYTYDKKSEKIAALKSETNSGVLSGEIDDIMTKYGLESHKLYTTTTPLEFSKTIIAYRGGYELNTPESAMTFLKEMLVLNAYNSGNEALIEKGFLAYADILGIDKTDWYIDYTKTILSDTGVSALNTKMLGEDYKSITEINNHFFELMAYHSIKNNTLSGSGHIEGLIKKYTDDYKNAGFKTELLNVEVEKKALLTKFLNSDATNLSELAKDFNKIFSPKSGGGSSSGGGGTSSGGGSSSGGGGNVQSGNVGEGFVEATPAPTPSPTPSTIPEPSAPVSVCPFTDMTGAEWAREAVEYLYKNKIVNGRTETEFVPNATVSRAELVKMICEAMGVAETTEDISFGDVDASAWYAPFIKRAAAAGIVVGDGGMFRPDGEVTREDAALIIYRTLGLEDGGEITFSDAADVSGYAKSAVAAMARDGYINGMGDGSFAPKATLTRAQAAQIIYNAITKGGAEA